MKAGQPRVQAGPLELVPVGRNGLRQQLWAVPGGARVTFWEVVAYARRMGWPRPVIMWVENETTGGQHA